MRKLWNKGTASRKKMTVIIFSAAVLCVAVAVSAIIPALADRKAPDDVISTPKTTIQTVLPTRITKPSEKAPMAAPKSDGRKATPTDAQARELFDHFFHCKSVYNSSLVLFLQELGLTTEKEQEIRSQFDAGTGISVREYENELAKFIDCFTMESAFLADNELDENDQLMRVREKKPADSITVKSLRAEGSGLVTVHETNDYTAYAYMVKVTENGINKDFRMEITYVDGHFVVYSCTETAA